MTVEKGPRLGMNISHMAPDMNGRRSALRGSFVGERIHAGSVSAVPLRFKHLTNDRAMNFAYKVLTYQTVEA